MNAIQKSPGFAPLNPMSQGTETKVLFVDKGADVREIMTCAEHRLDAARQILTALNSCDLDTGLIGGSIAKDISQAVLILLNDASDLYQAVRSARNDLC